MACYPALSSGICASPCGVAVPQPIVDSWNEPCVRQCPDSTVVIQPPPSVVTIPGAILSSFPQDSVVGSTGAPHVGAGFGGSFGSRGFAGSRAYLGAGGPYGSGGIWGYGGLCGSGGWRSGHRYLNGNCAPC
ncbi:claw keratin-like [Alligator mississippiensis]|uniref:claw keratin-like n=1 Tax=Alligator mississippiensis TaxID=8496 RepID=UPI00287765B0|nr:claw keratin-like [Alligator mississippiensis]